MSAHATAGTRPAHGDAGAWPPGSAEAWSLGPARPRLVQHAVHVWRADLAAVGDDVAAALGDHERVRAAQIADARRRRSWMRSRGVLRELLARYLGSDAGGVELAVGPHGKPELVGDRGQHPGLFFNLSHSRNLALYAFSADGPVGVDVQAAQDARAGEAGDRVALASRAFGEHEAQRLSVVAPAQREWEFLRAWTRHEAELKRLGRGLGFGAEADARPGRDSAVTPPDKPRTASWIVELDFGDRAVAALALDAQPSELLQWDWPA
jgi:4'-phosphopantetheinyl transferase